MNILKTVNTALEIQSEDWVPIHSFFIFEIAWKVDYSNAEMI